MYFVVVDFETASSVNLKKSGAWVYSESPTTEILCLGYQLEGEAPVVLGRDNLHTPPAWVSDPDAMIVAHNVGFEKAIWRNIMVPDYGWPDIPDNRWHDTMAVCAQKALPLSLDHASRVLHLDTQKDAEGSRVTIAMSKPNKKGYFDRSPEKIARVLEYNRQDLKGEWELHRRLGGLQQGERKMWLLDQRINSRGVGVDLAFVDAAQRVIDRASGPLLEEFAGITGGLKPTQRDKVMTWANSEGAQLQNLRKETLDILFGELDEDTDYDPGAYIPPDLPSNVMRALGIRRILGSASIKKLASMRACTASDGRVRGLLQYHGAGTGRWSGRLLQPQNFPRGSLTLDNNAPDPSFLVSAIMTGDPDYVETMFGPAVECVISSLRHALVAAKGHTYVSGDFSQIEARIVLALAGQHDKTALLAQGGSPYIPMAEMMFKRPISKKADVREYTAGKAAVLGAGFQMGHVNFVVNTKRQFGIDLTIEEAKNAIDTYRKVFAPEVPKLWHGLEHAAVRTVVDKKPNESHGVLFALEDMWMTVRLPSGRKLYYYGPKEHRKTMPWSTADNVDIRLAWTCWAQRHGRWQRRDMYGGLLTENVVQALARDIMAGAMVKCEQEGIPIVLTVHDEIVGEPETSQADEKMLDQIMSDGPQWAKEMGVPIAAETWSGERYKK